MSDDKPQELYESVLRSIEVTTLRRMAHELAPNYPFPWKWDRTRYSDNYLVQRVREEQVQNAIIDNLEFFRIDSHRDRCRHEARTRPRNSGSKKTRHRCVADS